jgi:UDP-galactopyranose mutase
VSQRGGSSARVGAATLRPVKQAPILDKLAPMPRALIIGAGLTGCTIGWRLANSGVDCVLLERADVPGGLIRSELMHGVLYEPHGSHIFHTEDEEVWRLANSITRFRDYRHRVDIVIEGKVLNWPILLRDIDVQTRSDEIKAQLQERRDVNSQARAQAANFEEWCLELMGPILYERYIKPYTEKQWGRPPRTLSAQWAPKRVSVRWDNNPYLFSDTYQGWPAGAKGYTDLIDGLLVGDGITLRTGVDVNLRNVEEHADRERADVIVLTCPLDVFAGEVLGELDWRGIVVRSVHIPHVQHAQGAMVVNYPALEYPFIRIHETKHASGQQCDGTVLGFEFTNAPTRYYPIEVPSNTELNDAYKQHIRGQLRFRRSYFAGRLANYLYLDMDDCMRQALDVAEELISDLPGSS